MNEGILTPEQGERLFNAVKNWTFIGRGYVGKIGSINLQVSSFGTLGGMRERDTREWLAESYVGKQLIWRSYLKAEYRSPTDSDFAKRFFDKIDKEYTGAVCSIEELVQHTKSLLESLSF